MKYLILVLGIILLIACVKSTLKHNGFKTYKIKMGQHRSIISGRFMRTKTLDFKTIFDNSAIYKTSDPKNQSDINKLYGFSDCNSHHQTNSARFGWRWYNNQLQILAYVYNDKKLNYQLIDSIKLNKEYNYILIIKDSEYIFSVNNKSITMKRTAKCKNGFYYKLFPYFGGDEKAPHDITIKIKENY